MAVLQPQPRPRSRIHWRTPVTMIALLAILAGGFWWGWKSLTTSNAEANCVEQTLPNNRMVPKQVVVNVYNGGAKAGTAGRVGEELEKRGFNVGKIANEPKGDKIDVVSVRGSTDDAPELKLVAGQLNQKALTVGDNRPDHTVDVVVGPGFTKLNTKGLPSVAVPADSIHCLPIVRPTQPIPNGQNPN
ncbi:LytR cell envelope-related transcriptional attenuator [Kribbella amoyensis]|uniref:LytR cell envelope-related transcriptional attenuator n=1 Tax=Kribbella amoyensis TaxID=996641 RepID=A0A561BPX2_9ACTN|nr:LytR C-terminal domain-containing protein [Kribbella amoyensis]TWD80928.1 LytR cell envelope-related transcriptional attenuator [Kribbella amoyensis]